VYAACKDTYPSYPDKLTVVYRLLADHVTQIYRGVEEKKYTTQKFGFRIIVKLFWQGGLGIEVDENVFQIYISVNAEF